jgi:hypothetical protein
MPGSRLKGRTLRVISRGRNRCNQEEEKVFHEHAGALFRVDEGGQTGGSGKEASRPPTQFWGRVKQYQGGVVAQNGTEFDLRYRFEDSLEEGDNHGRVRGGGRQGDDRDGKGAKGEAAITNTGGDEVSQQVDEEEAGEHHGCVIISIQVTIC